MVTTRSQARARAATAAGNANVRKALAPIVVLPAQKLDNGITVYAVNTKNLPLPKKTATIQAESLPNRVMTRSMTKRALKSAKVESWNTYTQQTLEQLKNVNRDTFDARKDRQTIWTGFIKHMLSELEQQTGNIDNKTICATNIYKILGYMFKNYVMDFASSNSLKKFWDTTFAKEKELLADIEKHYKNGKLTKEIYTESKKVIQMAQTYQIMYESFVFTERVGAPMKTPTLF